MAIGIEAASHDKDVSFTIYCGACEALLFRGVLQPGEEVGEAAVPMKIQILNVFRTEITEAVTGHLVIYEPDYDEEKIMKHAGYNILNLKLDINLGL